MPTKRKETKTPPVLCEKCGAAMSPTETREYREGLYKIDPNGDERKLCKKCKEKNVEK